MTLKARMTSKLVQARNVWQSELPADARKRLLEDSLRLLTEMVQHGASVCA
jgi:hypothetical protein